MPWSGAGARETAALDLTVEIEELDRFLHGPVTPGRLTGTVRCPALGRQAKTEGRDVELFVPRADERRRRVLYRGYARDREGRPSRSAGSS